MGEAHVAVEHTLLFVHDVLQSISITDELHLQHIHGFKETKKIYELFGEHNALLAVSFVVCYARFKIIFDMVTSLSQASVKLQLTRTR